MARSRCLALKGRLTGVALVIVLWMLALLTVIAGSMAFTLRTEVQTAANAVAIARAEAAADAGVFKAAYELSRPAAEPLRWQGNGLPHDWRYDEVALRITVVDEAAKVDINAAPEALLAGLFRAVGVDEQIAARLADAVVDWRDPDDLRRLNGAEKDDYLAAGRVDGPRNAAFESIEELGLVLGVDPELFRRVAPLVTVHSRRPGVDAAIARREVLLALPGASPEQVDAHLAQRHSSLIQGLPVAPPPFAPGNAARLGDTFSIQVDAVFGDNARFSREAVVRVTGNPRNPVVILAWRAFRDPLPTPGPGPGQ